MTNIDLPNLEIGERYYFLISDKLEVYGNLKEIHVDYLELESYDIDHTKTDKYISINLSEPESLYLSKRKITLYYKHKRSSK